MTTIAKQVLLEFAKWLLPLFLFFFATTLSSSGFNGFYVWLLTIWVPAARLGTMPGFLSYYKSIQTVLIW